MKEKNILIVGYPKSGTTWCTRLVAELIECPLGGEWGYDEVVPLYKEGEERISNFVCYKSHHALNELSKASSKEIFKIIYIVRDPRDVVVSGLHYFNFSGRKQKILKKTGLSFLNKYSASISEETKKKIMIETVLNGNVNLSKWLEFSWLTHHKSYEDADVLFVRYEDLLDHSMHESQRLIHFLEQEVSENHIKKSIEKQSFKKQKQEVEVSKNAYLKRLLRTGTHSNWKQQLSKEEATIFEVHFRDIETPYTF